jgi:hypothetical protein
MLCSIASFNADCISVYLKSTGISCTASHAMAIPYPDRSIFTQKYVF